VNYNEIRFTNSAACCNFFSESLYYRYFYIRSVFLIIAIWNKEELPEDWKESITVPIHKKGDKTDCNNYRGISLLPTTYNILSNILLVRLNPYAEEIMGDHQCGFRRSRSTTDHILCIRQIPEKKWKNNEAVHQLFTDFKKAYDSVRREAL
jgi:hypothetical protein